MYQNFDDKTDFAATKARIADLRKAFKTHKIDGLIVPRADEYQNEYVPDAHARLEWVSGFSGSAGTAIILQTQALLFVDGRYVLQAPDQVNLQIFQVIPLSQTHPLKWLEENLQEGQVIGIHPKLHTIAQYAEFKTAIEKAKASYTPLQDNLIDGIWREKPPPPETRIIAQPDALCGQTSYEKRKMIADSLAKLGHDVMVIAQPENIAWCLNIRALDVPHTPLALSFALINRDATLDWFVNHNRLEAALKNQLGADIRIYAPEKLADYLENLTDKTIRIDPNTTPQWFLDRLSARNPSKKTIIKSHDLCTLPKACKTKAEIDGAIEAHIRDGSALCRFLCWLENHAPNTNISEIDAAQKLEEFRKETNRLRDLSFDTISGTGANAAIIHYRVTHATNKTLKSGQLYLVDSGGQYQDGTTDVTRTVLIGGKAAPYDAVQIFTLVLQGHIALARARFPSGTTGAQLDVLARTPLWAYGLDFDHGTGHGVGSYLSVHEGPQAISKESNTALARNMIVSNEPGYYRAGQFGIRIENLQYVIVAPKQNDITQERPMLGFEVLTLAPIDKALIDTKKLNPSEKDWLNAYHRRVYDTLNGCVDAVTKSWLERACAPI